MSAGAILREALDYAPDVGVTSDANGSVTLYVNGEAFAVERDVEQLRALVLVGLLLAAAPHLADLIDEMGAEMMHNTREETFAAWSAVKAAIVEAGESL